MVSALIFAGGIGQRMKSLDIPKNGYHKSERQEKKIAVRVGKRIKNGENNVKSGRKIEEISLCAGK